MRPCLFTIAKITLLLFLSSNIYAQQDTTGKSFQYIQEVFQTELVYPQEKNEVQFTLAPNFQKKTDSKYYQIPFKIEYGITNAWQIELEWNSFQTLSAPSKKTLTGVGDMQLGTKYSFMNINNTNVHAAIGFEVQLPLGDETKELSEGLFEYEPYIILAWDIPKLNYLQLFTQTGISFAQHTDEDEEAHELYVNVGFFMPIKHIVFTSEINWTTNEWNGGDENQLYYTPGIVFKLGNNWESGVGMPIGLNSRSDKFSVIAMLTFEFNFMDDKD